MLSFSIILLTISSSFIILLIDEQLRLPCRLLVLLLTISSTLSYTAHHWAVATSMLTYSIILLIDEQFSYYTAHHWAVATSMSTYIVASLPLPLYCGILLLAKRHETKLVSILYCSSMSSSCIILLIIEQLRLLCSSWSSYCNILYPRSLLYLSQWELAKLHSCVVWRGLGAWWLRCHYMTSLSFISASCRLLWLQHHADFTAAWAAAATSISSFVFIVASDATPTLLRDYAAMKAVWGHTRSFLRYHCQLWLRHHADSTCGITANSIRCLIGRLAASLPAWVIFILLIGEQLWNPCRLISL
jgi:hypothetical protein